MRVGAFAVAAAACLVFVACVPVRAWVDRTLGADRAALLVDFGLYNVVYVAAAVSLRSGRPDAPRRERLGWWAMATRPAHLGGRLRELGCDTGQGFLWAAPEPVEDFLRSPLAIDAADRDERPTPVMP